MADQNVTLTLTASEAEALKVKLQVLMDEANGVDIWLAPGGEADVEGGQECFLDCDEEAHYRLGTILEKLGGTFMPHRDGGFHNPLELTNGTKAGTVQPETITLETVKLLDILNNAAEVEQRLESIGIEEGQFYSLASMTVSMLNMVLLDAGWNGVLAESQVIHLGNEEALVNPEHVWVVFQRSEVKPIEELPITGVYDTRERAVDAALGYLSSIDDAITSPSYSSEDEIIWKFADDQAECVALRMTKNF